MSLPGRVLPGIPQSPSYPVLAALHPRCSWVCDQQKKKNALRDILSLWGIHFWHSRRGKIGTDLYSRKKVTKAGIAISPGAKNDVLKETY